MPYSRTAWRLKAATAPLEALASQDWGQISPTLMVWLAERAWSGCEQLMDRAGPLGVSLRANLGETGLLRLPVSAPSRPDALFS